MEIRIVALVLFYIFTPILVLHLCHRIPFLNKLGSVIVAYILGLLLGNIGLLPTMGPVLNEMMVLNPKTEAGEVTALLEAGRITDSQVLAYHIYKLRDLLMSITILLAIPLILFSANVRQWGQMAGKVLAALLTGIISVVLMVVIGFFIFRGFGMSDLWKVSGMLIGVYTGGTPNLASLKMMLNVDANTYILTHTYDLIIGAAYLSFLMSVGQRLFNKVLPAYPYKQDDVRIRDLDGKDPFWGIFRRPVFVPLLKAYAMAIGIFGISIGLSTLVPESLTMVIVILVITTLGILVSLWPAINKIDKTFESGMYLILIFSLVVASMADVRSFAGITPGLFGYITWAVFGSLAMQVVFARFFKIDSDTVIIASTALVCSPPFVPVVAGALKNKEIIVPGITMGVIGYVVGNYLGFIVANVLKFF